MNSYLTVASGNGLQNSADTTDFLNVNDVGTADQTAVYTRDITRPEVEQNGFRIFDLDAGTFSITFSEPVNATAPFDTTSLSFQHHANSTHVGDSFQVQALTCPDCDDGCEVTFTFPRDELNRLKLTPRVCSSAANCWLTVESPGDFITDMAGNNLVELPNGDRTLSRSLLTFIDDTKGPVLLDFILNLTSRELSLTFDEPVNAATFDTTSLTLVAYEGATAMEETYQLTGGTLLTSDGSEVRIAMAAEDVNGLQARPSLATNEDDTWLTVSVNAASDLSYQQNRAQIITVQSSLVVPDVAPPVLSAFDIDFNDNTLQLVFSEPVTISSVQLTQLTLVSSRSPSPLVSYQITGGIIHPTQLAASAEVVFNLAESDIAFLKESEGIATNSSNTFMTALSGLAEDTSGTSNAAIDTSSAVGIRSLATDTTLPDLLSFTLDVDSGEMVLDFSDVVDVSTFDVSALTLQGQNYRVPLEWHSLSSSSSSASSSNSFTVTVFIGSDDLNRIKEIRTLATDESDTFLTVRATLVDDLAGLDVIAITDGKALQASGFTPDSKDPVLDSWSLDMDQSQLTLSFSETVDVRSIDVTDISLQPLQSTSAIYSLTGYAQLVPDDAGHVLIIQLSDTDADAVKLDTGLGTSRDNSFLSLSSSAISDMNSNDIVTISSSDALRAAVYVIDESDPVIISYDLDLNVGTLSLTFDEAVDANTFNVSGLTLVNRASQYTVAHTLTTSVHSTENGNEITVTFSKADLDSITSLTSLAAGPSSTFLAATKYTVRDMRQNQLSEISANSALSVTTYTEDNTNPILDSFSLNLSTAELSLTFTESVLATSLMPTEITIQSTDSGGTSVLLSGGSLGSQQAGAIVTLVLSEEDLNAVKLETGLGTSVDNTFIAFTSSAISDPAANPVIPVPATGAHQAAGVTQDSVPPVVRSFSLDLDERTLSFTFDEPILTGSFSFVGVALQDHASNPTQFVQLTSFSSSPTTSNGVEFVIDLSDTDLNALTATFPLATMESNTYLTLQTGTVRDMNNNPIAEIPSDNALQITSHEEDTVRPTLSTFNFDLNLGILTIEFSESVNMSSFDQTQITLQSSFSAPSDFFQLTGGLVSQPGSTTIEIDLLSNDLNTIKQTTDLASLQSNTYLSITTSTVQDMNKNPVVAVLMFEAELVNEFTEDESGPVVQQFDMDYDSGDMTLYFDETVDLSTFDASALTFRSINVPTHNSHTLFSSTKLDSGLLAYTRVQLGIEDLNELKRLRICTTDTVCYLSSSDTLVRDTATGSNQNEVTSPIQVSNYITDSTDPRVMAYPEFDLNTGTLTLEFSETVNVASINQSLIELHDTYTNVTHTFSPLQLSSLTSDGSTLVLGLGPDDQNRLKLDTDLCTYSENCWLRFESGFVTDVIGNLVEPIATNTMDIFHRPVEFVPDRTPPRLLSFTTDLDSGDLTFTFDEVVQLSTFDPTGFTFQDNFLFTSFVSLRENGVSYRSTDGLRVNWTMTKSDLNLLKSYELVFASLSSSYLTYTNAIIADVSLVGLEPRTDGVDSLQPSMFTPDTTRPELEGFIAFNFDNGSMTLQFSEPINISAINVTNIAIANNSTLDLHIYDPVDINAWVSVYYENRSVFNLTHLFEPGEYILTCPDSFLFKPTEAPPTTQTTPTATPTNVSGSGSGSGSSSGSGSGSGEMNVTDGMEIEMMADNEPPTESFYPLPLRGCTLYENRTVIEPFRFLTGGDLTYSDERKQQIMINFTRADLRYLKLERYTAENTWVAFNTSVFLDMSESEIIPSSLFNATKLEDGGFEIDITRPTFEFFTLDLDQDILSLYFNDVMDFQSVDPTLITISDYAGSNNSYTLMGPYDYPKSEVTIDQKDDFVINIPLSFDDYNTIKANLDLATDVSNAYVSFPQAVASDIYGRGRQPFGVPHPLINATQAFDVIPDTTGAILVDFQLDLNTHNLTLFFNEVVNSTSYTPLKITFQNTKNSSNLISVPEFQYHTLLNGIPTITDSMISTLVLQLDVDASAVKVQANLLNSESNSFITMVQGAVLDSSGNPNREILDGEALQAELITEDFSPPYLEYYDLDMTANTLTMKFFEAVRPDLFNPSGITLWSNRFTSGAVGEFESRQLSANSNLTFTDFDSVVILHFTEEDENYLKRPEGIITTSVNSSFLTLENYTAIDYVGLPVDGIVGEGMQVRLFFEGQQFCVHTLVHTCTCP